MQGGVTLQSLGRTSPRGDGGGGGGDQETEEGMVVNVQKMQGLT